MSPSRRHPYKLAVRFLSVACALGVMLIYSLTASKSSSYPGHSSLDSSFSNEAEMSSRTGRRLFSYEPAVDDSLGDGTDSLTADGNSTDCEAPRSEHAGYNDSCSYVKDQCSGEWVLFDYLGFILCDMKHVQVR